jgi:hypothetical protein
MEQTQTAWVYALIDPRDNQVKYIGKSINPKARLREHIYKCKFEHTEKGNWVKKLLSLSLEPQMKLLKEAQHTEIPYWEEYYIKHYKSFGINLLNYDDKGVGIVSGVNKKAIEKSKEITSRKVYQYDLNGNLIKEHKSLRDAERETGINHGNISKCCSGKFKHTGGFIFSYEPNNSIQPLKNPNAQKKKILELDVDGNVIAEYISIAEAAKITGVDASNVSRVCSGVRKHVKNKLFKFKE